MSNYAKVHTGDEPRTELHDKLGLTGAEVSINHVPAKGGVPFVHSHKENEEIYIILSGKGQAVIDGETVPLTAGDCMLIQPNAKRQLSASNDEGMSYICIQAKAGSLDEFTAEDAVIEQ
ncbi:MAG: cupin domain-containing protein [Clostridia bacterium]|nr:cupin domain-containing protein [Clostridia bacterium]